MTENANIEKMIHASALTAKDLLSGVVTPCEIEPSLIALYVDGMVGGDKTGWVALDRHYTVALGQWTLVTGYPGSGKSEWLDALLVNLAERSGWRFVIYSPENYPQELHVAKLLEKHLGKPFFPGQTPRMDEEEVCKGTHWLDERFGFIKQSQEQANSVDDILGECWTWCMLNRQSKNGIVIDPWNDLEHVRPSGVSETEYVSRTLSTIRRFARTHKVHVWIVAHPQKIMLDKENKRRVPTPSDVSGSAHFWNKADNAICVHRDQLSDSQIVQIYVQKIRFKTIGRTGLVELRYDRATGRYFELPLRVVNDPRAKAARMED